MRRLPSLESGSRLARAVQANTPTRGKATTSRQQDGTPKRPTQKEQTSRSIETRRLPARARERGIEVMTSADLLAWVGFDATA
jgi:hypothetical protein